MPKLYANAKLVKDLRIDVDNDRNHAICLDQPKPDGTDMGPTALELAVMGYAGCYASIAALTAKKMRISLLDLEVKTEAIKSPEVNTIISAKTEITMKSSAPKDRLQRLHDLTVKDCPVGLLFEKAGVKVEFKLNL